MSAITAIPARSAGDCRRALHYLISGTEPSDPPDAEGVNMMALARYSQQAAIDATRREGWDLTDPGGFLEHDMSGIMLRMRPLHRVAHPDFTDGNTVMAVITATSERRFEILAEMGPLVSHQREFDRLAVAIDIAEDRGTSDFNHHEPQFLILLNRATGAVEYEPIDVEELFARASLLKVRLGELADQVTGDTMPRREFERDSRPCSRCQWLTECHGDPEEPEPPEHPVTEDEFQSSMADYLAASSMLKETSQYEKQRDDARAVLKRYVQENGGKPFQADCNGETWQASVSVSSKPTISQERARKLLTAQQLADISAPSGRSTTRISQVK